MFINFVKVTFFTLVGSVLMIGNITLVNAKPNLCKPPVTVKTICSDCHNGNPGKATYIPNACVTVLNKPGNNGNNNGGNGNNNGGNGNNNGGNGNNNGGNGNNNGGNGNNNGGNGGHGNNGEDD